MKNQIRPEWKNKAENDIILTYMAIVKNVQIKEEFVSLGQFLKICDLISSGGEAKIFLKENEIFVNGEKEDRRGRKLYEKDLIKINDDYYYVRQSGEVVHGVEYWVTKNNGLVPSGRYTFGEDGKMVLTGTPLDTTPEPEVKNGIYEEDGVKYYYENGVKKYAGVIRLADPENPDRLLYYYVTSSCQLKTSGEEGKLVKYTASLTNGLLEVGRYQFDAQGRMYDLQGNLLTAPAN